MNEKKCVREFKKKYCIKKTDYEEIKSVIEKQGYTIIPYNTVCNNKNVEILITALQVKEYIHSCKCFTYQDDKYRLVFINEELSEEEKKIVLAHEEGHIWHEHMTNNAVFGEDVIQEHQANEFAHYLLYGQKIYTRKQKLIGCGAVCLLVMLMGCSVAGKYNHDKKIYTDNYYITNTGKKYHVESCVYVKSKKDVHKLTKEQYETGLYTPCSVCIPQSD